MIRYDLICKNDHNFEGWFSSSADYDAQRKKRLVECPFCGSAKVEKAIMAPAVATSRSKEVRSAPQNMVMAQMAEKLRAHIAQNCEDVGPRFAEEARAMHYGEKDPRGIYGQASLKEAQELAEEGIDALPVPDMLLPRSPEKLN